MTLQERLREAYLSTGANYATEAADALDAQEARIKALEEALRGIIKWDDDNGEIGGDQYVAAFDRARAALEGK